MDEDEPVVGGRYLLGSLLGRGGMAVVYAGYDQRLGRPVAVKKLNRQLAADSTAQLRFRREAHAAASLNHPAIAAVYDFGEEPDETSESSVPYIVMELVEGATLRALINEGVTITIEDALEIVGTVLSALRHSHAAGVIHRDIKPGNVMITNTGEVKVMDFGIARLMGDASSTLTQTAAVIGTAQYLSPEQAAGRLVDPRSDLYSVGCLLFELLTGRPPFVGESPVSIAYQHVREPAVAPSTLNPSVPPELDAFVLRALAKNPDDRFQTAAAMRAGLAQLSGTQPDLVAPPVLMEPETALPTTEVRIPTRPRRGRRTVVTVAVAAALAVLVVVVLALRPGSATDRPTLTIALPTVQVSVGPAEVQLPGPPDAAVRWPARSVLSPEPAVVTRVDQAARTSRSGRTPTADRTTQRKHSSAGRSSKAEHKPSKPPKHKSHKDKAPKHKKP